MESPKRDFIGDEAATVEQKKDAYNKYKREFLSGIDFSDEGTLRAPVFHAKVIDFI